MVFGRGGDDGVEAIRHDATMLFGEIQLQQADVRGLFVELPRKFAGFVPLVGAP